MCIKLCTNHFKYLKYFKKFRFFHYFILNYIFIRAHTSIFYWINFLSIDIKSSPNFFYHFQMQYKTIHNIFIIFLMLWEMSYTSLNELRYRVRRAFPATTTTRESGWISQARSDRAQWIRLTRQRCMTVRAMWPVMREILIKHEWESMRCVSRSDHGLAARCGIAGALALLLTFTWRKRPG
jgi:hypothetical protein